MRKLEDMDRDELMDVVEELQADLEEEQRKNSEMRERLLSAAEVMATTCRIDNTPHAKHEWIQRGTVRVRGYQA